MKLKHLKEQPLLNSPPTQYFEVPEITGKDRGLMGAKLAEFEAVPQWHYRELARMHFLLWGIGIKTEVSGKGKERMYEELEEALDKDRGSDAAHLLFYMGGIGLSVGVPAGGEQDSIIKVLETARTGKDGLGVARTHYWLREIGLEQDVTEQDREIMCAGLQALRAGGDGGGLAEMHVNLDGLGEAIDVTEEDIALIYGGLDKARNDGDGGEIAQMHYLIRRLSARQPSLLKKPVPTPPLKKFEK